MGAAFEIQKDRSVVVGGDFEVVGCAGGLLKSFHASARAFSHGNYSREVGAEFGDLLAGDPGEQVEPVGADVGDHAHVAAEFGLQAPVPVGGIEQPVLQEAAVNQARLADCTLLHQRAGLMAERVVAQVVGDGADSVRFACQINQRTDSLACSWPAAFRT